MSTGRRSWQRSVRGRSVSTRRRVSACPSTRRAVGNCVSGLPEVFDPKARPWVRPDRAAAGRIAELVMRCPTGALHFRRLDGGADEAVPKATTMRQITNGPLYVRGDVEVQNETGEVIRRDTRLALCRCGHSANKPFCDGSHRTAGFQG